MHGQNKRNRACSGTLLYIIFGGWTKGSSNLRVIYDPPLQHSSPLFGDLNTTGDTEDTLDVTVDGELTGSDGANHEETSTDTGVGAAQAKLLTDLHQTGDSALTGFTGGLVDLGKHGVGGLGDDGGGETGNQTGTEVDTGLGAVGEGVLVDGLVDGLGDLFENDELGHGVGDPVRRRVSAISPLISIVLMCSFELTA